MNEDNLIPLGTKGNEQRDAEIRAKCKGSSSQKRVDAQRTRRLREDLAKHPEKASLLGLELLDDPRMFVDRMMLFLKHIDSKDLSVDQELKLNDRLAKIFELWYGTKSKNVNLNAEVKPYQLEIVKSTDNERIRELLTENDALRKELGREAENEIEIRTITQRIEDKKQADQPLTEEEQRSADC